MITGTYEILGDFSNINSYAAVTADSTFSSILLFCDERINLDDGCYTVGNSGENQSVYYTDLSTGEVGCLVKSEPKLTNGFFHGLIRARPSLSANHCFCDNSQVIFIVNHGYLWIFNDGEWERKKTIGRDNQPRCMRFCVDPIYKGVAYELSAAPEVWKLDLEAARWTQLGGANCYASCPTTGTLGPLAIDDSGIIYMCYTTANCFEIYSYNTRCGSWAFLYQEERHWTSFLKIGCVIQNRFYLADDQCTTIRVYSTSLGVFLKSIILPERYEGTWLGRSSNNNLFVGGLIRDDEGDLVFRIIAIANLEGHLSKEDLSGPGIPYDLQKWKRQNPLPLYDAINNIKWKVSQFQRSLIQKFFKVEIDEETTESDEDVTKSSDQNSLYSEFTVVEPRGVDAPRDRSIPRVVRMEPRGLETPRRIQEIFI